MTDITIYFDGGGGGKNDKPFACAIVAFSEGPDYEESQALGWGLTNNIAEYRGLLLALDFAGRIGVDDLTLRSDSMLIVEQMLGNWRVKDPVLQELHVQANEVAARFRVLQIDHVPREQNRRADKLCNTEIDRQMRSKPVAV